MGAAIYWTKKVCNLIALNFTLISNWYGVIEAAVKIFSSQTLYKSRHTSVNGCVLCRLEAKTHMDMRSLIKSIKEFISTFTATQLMQSHASSTSCTLVCDWYFHEITFMEMAFFLHEWHYLTQVTLGMVSIITWKIYHKAVTLFPSKRYDIREWIEIKHICHRTWWPDNSGV